MMRRGNNSDDSNSVNGKEAQKAMQMLHDNELKDSVPDHSACFDNEFITKRTDGSIMEKEILSGGHKSS